MLLKTFKPSPPLREFIEFFRIVHFKLDGLEKPVKFYPPRPEHYLAFYPFDRERIYRDGHTNHIDAPPVMLSGQQLGLTRRLLTGQDFLVLHVVFQPAAVYRLTGIAAYELNNDFLNAELIFGKMIYGVNDALAAAKSYHEMLRIAEDFITLQITARCLDAHPLDTVCLSIGGWPRISVQQIALHSYLSSRQLQRKFRERTGLSPKLFERATRFHHTIDLRLKNPRLTWVDIAYQCGYSNYQHLVRDYSDFTGMTPTAYQLMDNQSPERQLGLADKSYKENTAGFLV
jgi:AraC-like DNA-binding protein